MNEALVLPGLYLDELYEMLRNVTQIFAKYGIFYFADYGTLLGISTDIREAPETQIPYLDNINLGTFNISKIMEVQMEFKAKYDYLIYQKDSSYALKIVSEKVGLKVNDELVLYPSIDILEYIEIGKDLIVIKDKKIRDQFKSAYHFRDHFFPMDCGKYGNGKERPYIEIPMPARPEFYLERVYKKER